MNSSNVLSVVTFVYALAAVLYIASWAFKKETFGKMATGVLLLGAGGNAAGILMRWVESYQQGIGHAPLSNLYESLVFFSLTVALIYLVIEFKYKERIIGVFASPLICLAIA